VIQERENEYTHNNYYQERTEKLMTYTLYMSTHYIT